MNLKKHLLVVGSVLVLLSCDLAQNSYKIPANSMEPTINKGDYITTKPCDGSDCDIERGNIVVFLFPLDPKLTYIKRVIGLGGDRIVYRNKLLTVKGEPAAEKLIGNQEIDGRKYDLYKQNLFNREFQILKDPNRKNGKHVDFIVPDNTLFVMGDNRDNSNDSRFWGTVPVENVVATYEK